MTELGLRDTNGVLRLPWVLPDRTSAGLGWDQLYVSTQRERPYRAVFDPADTHQLILHLNGPVTVRRGRTRLTNSQLVPPGGLFLHPAGCQLSVELGGGLDTVHVYLADQALQDSADGRPVELAEELGVADPLVEQLMLALDGVVRQWQPAARTYVDHLGGLLAAHLVRTHSTGRVATPTVTGLTDRQLSRVREMMASRLAEPLPLADLASVTGLSVSQFTRRFRAATGLAPHRFLMRLRVDAACRLLRSGSLPIAQIAASCGFSHQEHLTRVLRAQVGTTPGALRRTG